MQSQMRFSNGSIIMTNFIYKNGDMFNETADAIVNTVNCVGVMGKGVALEFKRRWKHNFITYKKACENSKLSVGKMLVVENQLQSEMNFPDRHNDYKYLINFPTKKHWRGKSKMEYLVDGLDDFKKQIIKYNIKSVVMPPLGCGNGQLNWNDVKSIIEDKLSDLDGVDIIIYEPKGIISKPEHHVDLPMTKERAIMLHVFNTLEPQFGNSLTHLCMQKITYFLQKMNYDFGLKFSEDKYGPYSPTLHKAFKDMEKIGYLDNFTAGECIVSNAGVASADDYFHNEGKFDGVDIESITKRIGLLFDGYASPFGAELLATVMYCSDNKKSNRDNIVNTVHTWNDRKKDSYNEKVILYAYDRLVEDKFIVN